MKMNWEGKRIVILGAARQGQAAARFLSSKGALVTVNDKRTSSELVEVQRSLKDLPITWVLGEHPFEILDGIDLVCISGGIPTSLPIVMEADKRGIPLTNDTQIFLEAVPCKSIGITGSAGKTTTTALIGQIAQIALKDSGNQVWVGGNIGDPLLNHIDQMQPDDLAILEISSFQLEQMDRSTDIAAVLNITPNHLDRHKTMEAYLAAKSRLVEYQGKDSITILCRDDPGSWSLREKVQGQLLSFGFSPMEPAWSGLKVIDEIYLLQDESGEDPLFDQSLVHLRGKHNQLNVMAASMVAIAAGLPKEAIKVGVSEFRGVAHRLEFVRTWGGADWYNDSIATTPERSMAAINSFDQSIVLLLGGRDKNLPWETLVDLIQQRVRAVVVFGEAADLVEKALLNSPQKLCSFSIKRCKSLKEAVFAAARETKPGDVVLFSPGGTSFDEFRDFEERGERFRQWVQELS